MTTLSLSELKALTSLQYDESREKALERVQKRIGEKPNRKQFQRELAPLWTVLDIIALVVFIPALIISSIHIISHMGKLASDSYQAVMTSQAGVFIPSNIYVGAHQILMIFLAEGSMILFMVLFGLSATPDSNVNPVDGKKPKQPFNWRRWVYFALAMTSLVFVAVANIQSGIGAMESVLAPIFTIGIGLKLELLIAQMLKRGERVDAEYLKATAIWEAATADATSHPDYIPMFRQEIWAKLVSKNREFADAPRGFKYGAVEREMARDKWAYEAVEPETAFEVEIEKPKREVKPSQVGSPFTVAGDPALVGNDGGTLGVNEMQPIISANGHHA